MKLSLPNVTLVGVEGVEKNLSKFLFAAEQCCKDIEFGEVKLLSHLDFDHKDRIEIGKIHNTAEYSAFIFHDIHNYISTEFMIIFQWDGFILNSSSWDQDFLNYDYVGSPWFDGKVGNGGFSLRSKKLMELCSKIQPMDPFEFLRTHHGGIFKEFGTTHEDGLFTPNDDALPAQLVAEDHLICRYYEQYLENKGMKFAPQDLAKKFSLEHNWAHPYPWSDQFGFHDVRITDISTWENYREFRALLN